LSILGEYRSDNSKADSDDESCRDKNADLTRDFNLFHRRRHIAHYDTSKSSTGVVPVCHWHNTNLAEPRKCAKLYLVELLLIAFLAPVLVGVGAVVALDRPVDEPEVKVLEPPAPEIAPTPVEEPAVKEEPLPEPEPEPAPEPEPEAEAVAE